MATFTFASVADQFPVGTSVGAYLNRHRRDGSSPVGSAVDTATVAANGSLAFDDLDDDTKYVAYALVNGAHRYRNFSTDRPRRRPVEIIGDPVEGDSPAWSQSAGGWVASPTVRTNRSDAVISISASAREEDIVSVFEGLEDATQYERVVFLGSAVELEQTLPVYRDRAKIDARRTTITQYGLLNGVSIPVFDCGNSDGVEIAFDLLEADDATTRYGYTADQGATIRSGRASTWSSAVWTAGHRGRFTGRVDGFYIGGSAMSWDLDAGALVAEGDYRYDNRFDLEVSNVDFGVLAMGQAGLETYLRGSYHGSITSIHPPHMLYVTTGRTSIDGRGKGHAWDSTGLGNVWQITRAGTVSGGTMNIDVGGDDVDVAHNVTAAALQAAVEGLFTVEPGEVIAHVYSGGWYLIFDREMGDQTVTVDDANITGGGTVTGAQLQPADSGGAWRFKAMQGGAYPLLTGRSVPGILEVYEGTTDLHVGIVKSIGDLVPPGGSIIMDDTVERLRVDHAEIDLTTESRAVRMAGTDNEVRDLKITASTDTSSSSAYVVIASGERNRVDITSIENTGAGRWYAASIWAGTGHTVKTGRMDNINNVGVSLASGVTDCEIDVDPSVITWASGAPTPRYPYFDGSTNETNRFRNSATKRKAPGVLLPQSPGWVSDVAAPTGQCAYFQRLVVDEWMLLTTIAFNVTTAAGSNDNSEVGLYDNTGTEIWTSGLTAGKLNSTTGVKTFTVPAANRQILPETVYYLGFWTATAGSTAVEVASATWTDATPNGGFFTAVPDAEGLTQTGLAGGLPANMSGATVGATTVPLLLARET